MQEDTNNSENRRKFNFRTFGFTPFERRAIALLVIIVLISSGIKYYSHQKTMNKIKIIAASQTHPIQVPDLDLPAVLMNEGIDLNIATIEELEILPGIGPKRANDILKYRKLKGHINSVDELINIKGIGPKTIDRIRVFIKPVEK